MVEGLEQMHAQEYQMETVFRVLDVEQSLTKGEQEKVTRPFLGQV